MNIDKTSIVMVECSAFVKAEAPASHLVDA